ncbi:hypothetical protein B0F90DRAFT_1671066 [Multifurca ochricompacta]|uniref:Uncharacterized protein n=1 Tax=Multifurca ochricompacta TaxID=376703 RepID=A0AAD4QG02_9AGAM|nr:hypothetical protein B0F90DRAFT_1671066 [Multifurca ochricompacta]
MNTNARKPCLVRKNAELRRGSVTFPTSKIAIGEASKYGGGTLVTIIQKCSTSRICEYEIWLRTEEGQAVENTWKKKRRHLELECSVSNSSSPSQYTFVSQVALANWMVECCVNNLMEGEAVRGRRVGILVRGIGMEEDPDEGLLLATMTMSPVSPADTHHDSSSFSVLALSDTVLALKRYLDSVRRLLISREPIQEHFFEFALDGRPWSTPNSTHSEKLLIDILGIIYQNDHQFLSTLDYGRKQDDHILMVFSRPSSLPRFPSASIPPALFSISMISHDVFRIVSPPSHLTPAILQAVRDFCPHGVRFEKKVAENVTLADPQATIFERNLFYNCFSLLNSLNALGFTLLTSLSINDRSRFKDIWVFTGPSYTFSTSASDTVPTPRELPGVAPQSPIGSIIDMTGIGTRNVGHTDDTEGSGSFIGNTTDLNSYPQVPFPQLSPSLHQADSQSSVSTPPLDPGSSRDSVFSSDTDQSTDKPIGKENDYGPRTHDPKENVLLGRWTPALTGIMESTFPGAYSTAHARNHTSGSQPEVTTEEQQEVGAGAAKTAHLKHQSERVDRAELVIEDRRAGVDRLFTPINGIPKKRDDVPLTAPNREQPGVSIASQDSRPSSQSSLQNKPSFPRPLVSQKSPFLQDTVRVGRPVEVDPPGKRLVGVDPPGIRPVGVDPPGIRPVGVDPPGRRQVGVDSLSGRVKSYTASWTKNAMPSVRSDTSLSRK